MSALFHIAVMAVLRTLRDPTPFYGAKNFTFPRGSKICTIPGGDVSTLRGSSDKD